MDRSSWVVAFAAMVAGCSSADDTSVPSAAGGWFTDVTGEVGLAFTHDAGARGALALPEIMGSGGALFDADGDGDLDAYLVNAGGANAMFVNEGGRFTEATAASGLGDPGYGMGVAVGDYDNDGDRDLAIANGRVTRGTPRPGTAMASPWDRYAEPNLFYAGERGTLVPAGEAGGAFTGPIEITRGLAAGDVDGDGDLDLLATNTQGPARLYRNDAPRRGGWLAVRCLDPELGRDAIGAVVTLRAGGASSVRTISGGSSYMSSSPPVAHFGLGGAAAIEFVDVRWPDGRRERFVVDGIDQAVTLVRGTGERLP